MADVINDSPLPLAFRSNCVKAFVTDVGSMIFGDKDPAKDAYIPSTMLFRACSVLMAYCATLCIQSSDLYLIPFSVVCAVNLENMRNR